MNHAYIRLNDEDVRLGGMACAPAELACWAALVHAWDDIGQALGEVMAAPARPAAEVADRVRGLAGLRPLG